ncbi:siderophore-interacting protein [Bdellovibrio sp. HCB185ZH]|uniref:siderophore-interacting protein n=1 Tax=Bdellovibrio sp. HCB185ZH TaxID=3394235 RepID=UPI0039A71C0B
MEQKNRDIKTVMHEVKRRVLTVKRVEQVTSRIKRITFTGDDLSDFISLSPDDHIKAFFPYPGETDPVLPVMGPNGLQPSADGRKPIMRDYTPKRIDSAARELDIEFVLHGEGPGSQWAQNASIGQTLTIGGPRGSRVVPYNFDWYLMIGDESAIPSFARRLQELPKDSFAVVVIETEDPSQKIDLSHSGKAEIHWLYRNGRPAGQVEELKLKIASLPIFDGDYFAWIALEKSCAMQIKELLITIRGAREEWIKATGYWSAGQEH